MRLLVKEGRSYLLILAVLTVGLYFVNPLMCLIPLLTFLFLLFFFRDPNRSPPLPIPGIEQFVSPADGQVTAVGEVNEGYLFGGKAQMVTIFLSPLDVHVNRAPMGGLVTHTEHKPGLFRPAYISEAPSVNERNYIVIENAHARCLVVQIVGVLARRVVCWVEPGQSLKLGERVGLMKFGSCMQVFSPITTTLKVAVGDRVRAGETLIGVMQHE